MCIRDRKHLGCRQEGHPDIKWLTAPAESPAMQAPSNPQYWGKIDVKCKNKKTPAICGHKDIYDLYKNFYGNTLQFSFEQRFLVNRCLRFVLENDVQFLVCGDRSS